MRSPPSPEFKVEHTSTEISWPDCGGLNIECGGRGWGGARGGWLGEGEANGVRGQGVLVIGVWLVACRVPSGHHARAQEGHSFFDNRCISERAGARRSHGAPPHLLRVYRPAGRMWIQRNCQAMAWRTNKTVGAPPRLLRVYCPAGRTRLQRNRQALAWRTKKTVGAPSRLRRVYCPAGRRWLQA